MFIEATDWQVFVTCEKTTQRSGQEYFFFVRNNSNCKEEVVVHVQENSP